MGAAHETRLTAEKVLDISNHLHSRSRIFGMAVPQTAVNWGTRASLNPYIATSGLDDFGPNPGDEALVIGSADTPSIPGNITFGLDTVMVTGTSSATLYIIRFIYGTGTMADAEAAEQYSDTVYLRETPAGRGAPVDISLPALPVGTKVWARTKNTTNGATIEFTVSLHGHTESL